MGMAWNCGYVKKCPVSTDIFQRFDETHIVNQAIHQATPLLAHAIKETQENGHLPA
jgi:hypothetical protein